MTDPTSRAPTLLGLLASRVTWTGAGLAPRLGRAARPLAIFLKDRDHAPHPTS